MILFHLIVCSIFIEAMESSYYGIVTVNALQWNLRCRITLSTVHAQWYCHTLVRLSTFEWEFSAHSYTAAVVAVDPIYILLHAIAVCVVFLFSFVSAAVAAVGESNVNSTLYVCLCVFYISNGADWNASDIWSLNDSPENIILMMPLSTELNFVRFGHSRGTWYRYEICSVCTKCLFKVSFDSASGIFHRIRLTNFTTTQ